MEAPRGVEPTGTNGRTRHTFRPFPLWWVGSRPVVVSFVGWQGALFLVVTETIPVKRLVARVRCPVPGPPRSESWHGSVCRPIPWWVGRYIGFAVVMAQVRRPVPFRTRKLRPGRGDGTALERVWESSTPPHSFVGVPVERDAPGTPFLIPAHGCLPPFGGGKRTPEGPWTGGFLRWVEVFGLWKACGRTGYSSEWMIWDAEICVGR